MIATSPGRSDCVFSTRRLGGQATTTWGFEHDSSSGAQCNAVCPSRDFRGSREPGRRIRRPTIYNPAVSDDSGHRFAGHSAAAAMSSIPLNFPRQRGQGFIMATCNFSYRAIKGVTHREREVGHPRWGHSFISKWRCSLRFWTSGRSVNLESVW
jgi:hypothetical protein